MILVFRSSEQAFESFPNFCFPFSERPLVTVRSIRFVLQIKSMSRLLTYTSSPAGAPEFAVHERLLPSNPDHGGQVGSHQLICYNSKILLI